MTMVFIVLKQALDPMTEPRIMEVFATKEKAELWIEEEIKADWEINRFGTYRSYRKREIGEYEIADFEVLE